MTTRLRIGLGFAVAASIALGEARAQTVIVTVAGRGIGDGRAATAASLDAPTGVSVSSDGTLLIADDGHQRVRRVETDGTIDTYVGTLEGVGGNGATPDVAELKGPVRTFVTAAGDVLIAERDGNRVRRVRHDTGTVDTFAGTTTAGATGDNGPATAATLTQPNDLAEDSAGNIYIADMGNHRIRRVDTNGIITTVAGTGTPGFNGDGNATNAQLNFPACVLVGPGDALYVCDKANHRIRRVLGGTITTVAGVGTPSFADGPALTAGLNEPEDMIFDSGGNIVIADQENNRIRLLDVAGATISTLAGTGPSGFGGENANATTSTLASPMGLALAADGGILFAERDANRLRKLAGGTINTIAGDGISRFGGDGGPALDATFRLVEGVAQDAAGNLYISDSGNNRIRKVDMTADKVSTIAGNGTTSVGVDNVPATVVGLDSPSDIVVDAAGNVIFSDTNHHRVRSVDTAGKIHTIIGNGTPGFAGDGGPAASAQVNAPTGLALDSAGNLYVADFLNNRIRKIDTSGNVSTVAGTGDPTFNGDGLPATQTALFNPTDVAFEANGNMVIADMRNDRVRVLDAVSGTISTIAGTGQALSSDDFIPALTASLILPTDVAVDADGNVLIADSGSNRVRRVSPDGVIDTVAGSRTPGDSGDGGSPTDARLLTPLRLQLASNGTLLIVDHDNARIRAVGVGLGGGGGGGGGGGSGDCTDGTCIAGGGSKKTDCFMETTAKGAVHGQKVICTDGDASCDGDDTPGSCTFSIRECFGVSDPRLGRCHPAPVTSVLLQSPKVGKPGASSLVEGLSTYAPAQVGGGTKALVSFTSPVSGCTNAIEVAVPVKKKKAKLVLKMTAVTGTSKSSKDPDTVVLVCQKAK